MLFTNCKRCSLYSSFIQTICVSNKIRNIRIKCQSFSLACSFTVSNICFFAVDCVFSLCSRIGIYVLCTHTRLYVDACEAPRDRIRTVNCAFRANFNVHFTPIILASLRFDFVYSFESNDLTVKKVAWL